MKGAPQESRKAPARAKGRKAKAGGGELVKSPAERVASPPYQATRHYNRFHIQGPSPSRGRPQQISKGITMKKTTSERLEDARTTLEDMLGELFDIACELPYGSPESESILSFRFHLASMLKAGALPHLPEEQTCSDEEDEDVAA